MPRLTWLGDEDPSAQVITQYGVTFVKGVATEVPDDKGLAAKFEGNKFFSKDASDPIESKEPEPVDPEQGTEKAALKAALRLKGVELRGNPSVETLRRKLADTEAKEDAADEAE